MAQVFDSPLSFHNDIITTSTVKFTPKWQSNGIRSFLAVIEDMGERFVCEVYDRILGVLRLASGANLVPWCGTVDEVFYSAGFRTPFEILHDAGRPAVNNRWGIDPAYQLERTTLASRNQAKGLYLRSIATDPITGRYNILATPSDSSHTTRRTATSLQALELEEAHLASKSYTTTSTQDEEWSKPLSLEQRKQILEECEKALHTRPLSRPIKPTLNLLAKELTSFERFIPQFTNQRNYPLEVLRNPWNSKAAMEVPDGAAKSWRCANETFAEWVIIAVPEAQDKDTAILADVGCPCKPWTSSTVQTTSTRDEVTTPPGHLDKRENSLNEVLLAFQKRNGAVPELSLDSNIDHEANILVRNFASTAIDRSRFNLLADFKAQPVEFNSQLIREWVEIQSTDVLSKLVPDEPGQLHDWILDQYSYMIKNKPKPPLSEEAMDEYTALQTIAYHEKFINAVFCPLMREIKRWLLAVLDVRFLLFTDVSPDDFADKITRTFSEVLFSDMYMGTTKESDIRKFDKSQLEKILRAERKLLVLLGLP
ncbi:hypothetical protein GE061_004004 [Apolygus lucorum]|uniref:RNA-dependent RNA polymerase alsuviricetes domain-containing protein n=1 Tax=Apolygus lucorum TaxID=248454 RepID=A0A8S9WXZ2_APOLU|nr:hypothetical protein GE061_004004 [Apolygus lucorum]